MSSTQTLRLPAAAKQSDALRVALSGDATHLTVTAENDAFAVVLDTSNSPAHRITVHAAAGAEVHIVSLSSDSVRTCESELQEGARVFWHCFTLGSSASPHTLKSTLTGAHAMSDVDWVFSVCGNEQQRVSVRNVFGAPSGGGEITLKGVAEGKAHAACDGMIEITEQGGGTDTYLTEDVLMLDSTAKIDAVPGLEIRTNDVKASHSATVSRVTPEDLFYFRSRGIDPETARSMYVEGFLGDLTERIPDEAVKHEVQKVLCRDR